MDYLDQNPFEGMEYPVPVDQADLDKADEARQKAVIEDREQYNAPVDTPGPAGAFQRMRDRQYEMPENMGLIGAAAREWSWGSWALEDIATPADPNFQLTQEKLDYLRNGDGNDGIILPDEVMKDIAPMVKSDDHLRVIRDRYARDQRVLQYLSEETGGTMAQIAMAIADPWMIPVFAALAIPGGQALSMYGGAIKAARMRRLLAAGNIGGAAAGSEYLRMQYDPQTEWSDVAIAGLVGGGLGYALGPVAKNPATAAEAQKMYELHNQAVENVIQREARDSAGAARNTEYEPSLLSDTPILDEEGGIRAPMGPARLDPSGRVKQTDNRLLRETSDWLMGDNVGASNTGPAPRIGVFAKRQRELTRVESQYHAYAEPQFEEWMRETGKTSWMRSGVETLSYRHDFMQEVFRYLQGADDVSPQAKKVGGYMANEFSSDLTRMRIAEVPGWEAIKDAANGRWAPMYTDPDAIKRLRKQLGPQWKAKLYQVSDQAFDWIEDANLRTRVSRGYIDRMANHAFGLEDDIGRIITGGNEGAIRDMLREIGIEGADADGFVASWRKLKEPQGDPRQKSRAGADYYKETLVRDANGNMVPVKIADLFNQNAEIAFMRYQMEMKGRLAMAETPFEIDGQMIMNGIKSDADFNKLRKWIADNHRQYGDVKDIEGKLKTLDTIYDAMKGRSLSKAHRLGYTATQTKVLRMIRDWNFIRLMANLGVNQAMEFANVLGTFGFKAAVQSLPSFRYIMDNAGRLVNKDKVVRELQLMGVTDGNDRLFNRASWETLAEEMSEGSALARGWNRMMLGAKDTVNVMSGMRWINSYQKQLAMKAAAQRVADMAVKYRTSSAMPKDFRKAGAANKVKAFFTGKDLKRLNSLGLSDDQIDNIFRQLLDPDKVVLGRGNKVHELNLDRWDMDAREDFLDALSKWTGQVIQRNDPTAMALFMEDPTAKLIFQFRSFAITAYTKQLQYGLNHMDARQAITWAMQVGAGGTTFFLMKYPIYAAMTNGEQKRKYWEEHFTPEQLAKNAVARTGFATLMPDVIDTVNVNAGTGKPIFGSYRTSGTGANLVSFNMLLDPALSGLKLGRTLAMAPFMDRKYSQAEIKSAMRALPMSNYLPLSIILQGMISDRRATKPREQD